MVQQDVLSQEAETKLYQHQDKRKEKNRTTRPRPTQVDTG
jgi:hypothetical protein